MKINGYKTVDEILEHHAVFDSIIHVDTVSFIAIMQSYNVLLSEKFHKKHRSLHIFTENITFAV